MQRIFIAFFIAIAILASLVGLGVDYWSKTDGFRKLADSAIQSAADESGTEFDAEKSRADLRTAALLIFFTIATMAWMPIIGITIRAKILNEDIFASIGGLQRFRTATAIGLGLWITNLIAVL